MEQTLGTLPQLLSISLVIDHLPVLAYAALIIGMKMSHITIMTELLIMELDGSQFQLISVQDHLHKIMLGLNYPNAEHHKLALLQPIQPTHMIVKVFRLGMVRLLIPLDH